jgi:membrane protein
MSSFLSTLSISLENHGVRTHSAAIAFYLVSCLAPLLLLVLGILSFFLTDIDVRSGILQALKNLFGTDASKYLIENIAPWSQETSILTTILGTLFALIGAAAVFRELRSTLDTIFEVPCFTTGRQGVLGILGSFATFGGVLLVGFFLTLSLVTTMAAGLLLGQFQKYLQFVDASFIEMWNFFVSFFVITLLFMFLQRFVSSARLPLRITFLGSFITALLFTMGKTLFGFYLGFFGVTSSYGVASSVFVLLLWLYYSTQIFFLGAEITAYIHKKTLR